MCHAKYYALLEKKRFLAPIGDNPHKILDLGCGTGKSALFTLHVLCHATVGPGAMAGR
jgi:ubiquinone/menaquinone biosynthesis C-methylase UbiE